jgi:hypothetical protein
MTSSTGKEHQGNLELQQERNGAGPVECLGLTFENDQARREHFTALLREKLQEPEFRKIPGFPQGSDEAILQMSDPPHYTACPNPFLEDFVRCYGKPYDPDEVYEREPTALDVSIPKTDLMYKAHSYHTKVPYVAIVPSILNFTKPGDVILDGFCGSGMTGVAAQWCGNATVVQRQKIEGDLKAVGMPPPQWGTRKVVLQDLSPVASFISANNNLEFIAEGYEELGKGLLRELSDSIGWMYETTHSDGARIGRVDYTVWSEVFACSNCGHENIFLLADKISIEGQRDRIVCSSCNAEARKEEMEIAREYYNDGGEVRWRPKRFPVEIYYELGGKQFSKKPDDNDMIILKRIQELPLPARFPRESFRSSKSFKEGRMRTTNTTSTTAIFLPRAAHAIAHLWGIAEKIEDHRKRMNAIYSVEQAIISMSILNRYRPTGYSQIGQHLTGVFYVGSQHAECSPWYILEGKHSRVEKAFKNFIAADGSAIVGTGSSSRLLCPGSTIDYVYVDPPFGFNIFYADLNKIIEAWHGVVNEVSAEAVIDDYAKKDIRAYQRLMQSCFEEFYRVLKPGRWMTVVFSNSQAKVWNAIQLALQEAGFVVAEVSTLDKQQGSFKQVTSPNAVKQDLVISAYKPSGEVEAKLSLGGATAATAWKFVDAHIKQLPISKIKNNALEFLIEREPRRIFDRMVAWFVLHDKIVPISLDELMSGIQGRYPTRDGMVFHAEQVAIYDKNRTAAQEFRQFICIVTDEASAIQWVRQVLSEKPQTPQDLHPQFMKAQVWAKHEALVELSKILEQNFLRYDGRGPVPSQIHSYLSSNFKDLRNLGKEDSRLIEKARDRWYVPDPNKQADLDQIRERALLKEFEEVKESSQRKIKQFRTEAIRAGFKACWQERDYATIVKVAAKLPEAVLQEDEKLLMYVDNAQTRLGDDG